jgi:YidC/Oxa1 family membrane protein insertase
MFDLLFEGFSGLVAFFYSVIPSYGVAIILLTVAVRLLMFPLTAKQAKSMYAMQRVQPELKRLQQKYKNDRQKLNEEMMKFYRENNINPLAGCLPLLLQFPLFIVLYQVINGLTHTVIAASIATGAIGVGGTLDGRELEFGESRISGEVVRGVVTDGTVKDLPVLVDGRQVGTVKSAEIENGDVALATVVDDEGVKLGEVRGLKVENATVRGDPKYISKDTDLYQDLGADKGKMPFLGIDLARSAGDDHDGFGDTLPYFFLVALVVATGYYQQRQMTSRNPQAAQNPQAQMMGKIFPALFGVISLNIAAGVVLYFVVSNLWQIGQQAILFRTLPAVGSGGTGAVIEAKEVTEPKEPKVREPKVKDKKADTPPPSRARPSGNGRATERGTRSPQRQRKKRGR